MSTSPSSGPKRAQQDILKLIEANFDVAVGDVNNELNVKFHGPKGTHYEGGVWSVHVHLPDRYPFKSPSIGFINKIYHPNIDESSGSVCLDVINQSWSALFDLKNVFEQFLPQLLTYPNPMDPLNSEAASLYLHKPDDYKRKVTEYVRLYATEQALHELEAREQARARGQLDQLATSFPGASALHNFSPMMVAAHLRPNPRSSNSISVAPDGALVALPPGVGHGVALGVGSGAAGGLSVPMADSSSASNSSGLGDTSLGAHSNGHSSSGASCSTPGSKKSRRSSSGFSGAGARNGGAHDSDGSESESEPARGGKAARNGSLNGHSARHAHTYSDDDVSSLSSLDSEDETRDMDL